MFNWFLARRRESNPRGGKALHTYDIRYYGFLPPACAPSDRAHSPDFVERLKKERDASLSSKQAPPAHRLNQF